MQRASDKVNLSDKILKWYDHNARILPFRTHPSDIKNGLRPNPYHVWLSEVMLQQTTIKAVIDYFHKFIALWPTIFDLAAADNDDVMAAWAGLGYYSRARNLHKCAKLIVSTYDGNFPKDAETLQKLPGIGPYTSAAIASIAFDQPAPVVDGNIERVVTRLKQIATPLPDAKSEIRAYVEEITPQKRPGDFAQAMMDIGATLCTPKNPVCGFCPLHQDCASYKVGDMLKYPVKKPKAEKPHRYGLAVIVIDENENICVEKMPEKGLFGGMYVFPYTDQLKQKFSVDKLVNKKDIHTNIHNVSDCHHWINNIKSIINSDDIEDVDKTVENELTSTSNKYDSLPTVKHIFTHFSLDLESVIIRQKNISCGVHQRLVPLKNLEHIALPSLMKKLLKHLQTYMAAQKHSEELCLT
ncbi:MAG: A/G-specific adenine glycosylase [Pseudomonadota bacterium]